MRVAPATEKPWELTQDQVTLLKNYLRMGSASEMEVRAGLEVARRYKLDPFKQGQIWFIKRWDKNADNGQGGQGAFVWTPQVGIYGFAHIAARDHKDYGSLSEPEFGPMFMHEVEGHKFRAPEWCRVKAFKKGIAEPTVATIYFEEFCPKKWENCALFWRGMPRNQIAKCAKAQVIRFAWPDLAGLYIPEEMERMNEDYTPGGRQIVTADGTSPSGRQIEYRPDHGSHSAAQNVLRDKLEPLGLWCAKHNGPTNKCPSDEHTRAELEEMEAREVKAREKPIDVKPQSSAGAVKSNSGETTAEKLEPARPGQVPGNTTSAPAEGVPKAAPLPTMPAQEFKYRLEIDWTVDVQLPALIGDVSVLGNILVGKYPDLTLDWKGELWRVKAKDATRLMQIAGQNGFAVKEIHPQQVSGGPKRPASEGSMTPSPAPEKPSAREEQRRTLKASAAPALETVTGIIEQANPESGKAPRVNVLFKIEKVKHWMSAFDTALFPPLTTGKGQEATLIIQRRTKGDKTFTNIVGLKKVGPVSFDEDGKTPCLDRNREAGSPKTLWE